MLVVDQSINVSLKDSNNQVVGESFIEQSLDGDGGGGTNSPPLRFLYIPKPNNGNYSLELTSSQVNNYQMDLYLYDRDGNVKIVNTSGIVGGQDLDKYLISFNKNTSSSSSSSQNITFDTLIQDLHSLRQLNELNLGVYKSLLALAESAKKLSSNSATKKASANILKQMDMHISLLKNKGVTQNAYNILHKDIQAILQTL
jgi:hypothetical protein